MGGRLEKDYKAFLESKRLTVGHFGVDVSPSLVHPLLKPFQRDQVIWALKKGRCAEWGAWATWYGIRETETLNAAAGRDDKDDKHICPLQLRTIDRCIRLWSNPGEIVLDPFGGIGSTGYKAIELGRKAILCELKQSYFRTQKNNLTEAVQKRDAGILFEVGQ